MEGQLEKNGSGTGHHISTMNTTSYSNTYLENNSIILHVVRLYKIYSVRRFLSIGKDAKEKWYQILCFLFIMLSSAMVQQVSVSLQYEQLDKAVLLVLLVIIGVT